MRKGRRSRPDDRVAPAARRGGTRAGRSRFEQIHSAPLG
jgi:hypothetical protein